MNLDSENTSSASVVDIKSLSKSLRLGNTQVHHQIEAKKESLNRQAKRQRAEARYNWYEVARYIKNRVVSRKITEHQEEKNKKLDVYADVAVEKLCSAIRFNLAEQHLQKITADGFEPIKFYKKPVNIPTIEDAGNAACVRYINNMNFDSLIKDIAPKFVAPVKNVDSYENNHPTEKKANNEADDVADVISKGISNNFTDKSVLNTVGNNVFVKSAPLYSFPQDSMILNPINDMDKIVSQAAQISVKLMAFNSGIPYVSKACRKPLRSLGRFAYPAADNEEPLDMEREPTLDEDELDNSIRRASKRILRKAQKESEKMQPVKEKREINENSKFEMLTRPQTTLDRDLEADIIEQEKEKEKSMLPRGDMFYYDLSSILPGLDDGLMAMFRPIPSMVLDKCIFSRQLFSDEIMKPNKEIAKAVAQDSFQAIPEESLSFIDEEIDQSVKAFLIKSTGMEKEIEEVFDRNIRIAERTVFASVAAMTVDYAECIRKSIISASKVDLTPQNDHTISQSISTNSTNDSISQSIPVKHKKRKGKRTYHTQE